MSKNEEICNRVLDRVTKAVIQDGLLPWHKPWSSNPPVNAITGKPYKGINYIALITQDYTDPRWLTFNQAKDLGGSVRKGESHTGIVKWQPATTIPAANANTTNDTNDATANTYKPGWFRYYMIFNVEQTEGVNLPSLDVKDNQQIKSAESVHVNYLLNGGPKIKHGGNKAYYAPLLDYIQLPKLADFDNANEYHGTRFHEEVHSTGHSTRLDRKLNSVADLEGYSYEELIAELGSAMLRALTGIEPNINNSAAYIKGWQKAFKDDPNILAKAAAKAQKAVDLILAE